jgi:hypothetical protein
MAKIYLNYSFVATSSGCTGTFSVFFPPTQTDKYEIIHWSLGRCIISPAGSSIKIGGGSFAYS